MKTHWEQIADLETASAINRWMLKAGGLSSDHEQILEHRLAKLEERLESAVASLEKNIRDECGPGRAEA